jgi:hypothetical protein
VSAKFEGRPRIRVAVRLPEENARLVNALSIALSEEAGSVIDSRLVETKERI